MNRIPQPRPKVRFICDDPTLTPFAGLALVAQVDRVLGVTGTLDELVPPIKRRRQGASTGQLLVALAECQLAGGDFFADLDALRADAAGAVLRAVPQVPSARTGLELAGRFGPAQLSGIGAANRQLIGRYWQVLPERSRSRLRRRRPTIDIDPTDVAVYGPGKQGVGFTYRGVRAGRPVPVCWAEAGLVLTATLLSGNQDVRPHAETLIAQAARALPAGVGRPRFRADSGLFSADVAWACLDAGGDFAIAAPRTEPLWAAMRQVPARAWRKANGMTGAQVAVIDYAPAGFPPGSYTIVRRVKYSADDISADLRARRRRTIDPNQLPLALGGEITTCYAYSFIVTNLRGNPVRVEAWFRNRGQVEERIKDSKLGMALRHLPSGRLAANQTWMWACCSR